MMQVVLRTGMSRYGMLWLRLKGTLFESMLPYQCVYST